MGKFNEMSIEAQDACLSDLGFDWGISKLPSPEQEREMQIQAADSDLRFQIEQLNHKIDRVKYYGEKVTLEDLIRLRDALDVVRRTLE